MSTLNMEPTASPKPEPARRPKVLFTFSDDRFFWSHRLSVARAALRSGYEVVIATGVYAHGQEIQDEGFKLIPLELIRKNRSLLKEFRAVRQLRRVYREERPDIVHQVAIKAVLYGSMASVGLSDMPAVNALTGLGYLVASSSAKAAFLRAIVWRAFRFLLNHPEKRVLVENQDDRDLVVSNLRIPSDKVIVTRGSGVDTELFQPTPEPGNPPVVVLASRMLWIKGIKEFIQAAQMLQAKGVAARFILAGDSDPNNPSCVPRDQLLEWQESGIIEWWGHQRDMPHVFKQASFVCLPSHGGEGVPKVLMEAAACGRAIVTTDVPGCREVVQHGVNGLLVPPGEAASLAAGIEQLLSDPEARRQMAARGRQKAVDEFSEAAVIRQTLVLYSELLDSRRSALQASAQSAHQQ
jgi:glycosyltransferase involved in cell wall biosynthesis